MNSAVPEGWKAHDLGDLAEKIEGGGTPPRDVPEYWHGGIPWATVKDLKKVELSTTQEFISEHGLSNSSSKMIPANTMIIASRMAVGKAVFFNKGVAINQDLKAFHTNGNVDWRFLLHWYLSKSDYIESLGTGSTVKGIRLEDLKLLPVDLPPLPEQQKIAAILSSVDEVIETTQAQIDKLKDLKTGMMQELLTKGVCDENGKHHTEFKDSPVGRIPVGWDVKHVQDCCVKMTNGFVGATRDIYRDEGVDYVLCQNVRPNLFIEVTHKYVDEEFHQKNIRACLYEGDVLTVQTGAGNGDTCVVPKSYEGANCHALIISRPKPNILNSYFFAEYMNSDFGKKRVSIIATGGAHPHLNTTDLRRELIPVPPIEEQNKITSTLSSIQSKFQVLEKKKESFAHAKKALMQDLLTGKVRVTINKEKVVA